MKMDAVTGFMLACFFSFTTSTQAAEFSTIPIGPCETGNECTRAIVMKGEITAGTSREFENFFNQQAIIPGLKRVILLHSPGGSVESSLALGNVLFEKEMWAIVGQPVEFQNGQLKKNSLNFRPGLCASACVYTLMGAKRRMVVPESSVGVHRMSAQISLARDPAGGGRPTAQRIFAGERELAALREYVRKVGGSQELVTLAESVPHDQIRILTPAELRRFKLTK